MKVCCRNLLKTVLYPDTSNNLFHSLIGVNMVSIKSLFANWHSENHLLNLHTK